MNVVTDVGTHAWVDRTGGQLTCADTATHRDHQVVADVLKRSPRRHWGDHTSGVQLFSEDLLVAQGEQWVVQENNANRVHGQLGTTPLRSWVADPNQLRQATREQLVPAMLSTRHLCSVYENGIRLDGIDCVAAELDRLVGRKVSVRYLPDLELERLFIEVFNGDEWVCTVYPSHTVTPEQRAADLLVAAGRDAGQLRRPFPTVGAPMRAAWYDQQGPASKVLQVGGSLDH